MYGTNGNHVHHLEMEPDDEDDMTPLTSSVGSGAKKTNLNQGSVLSRVMGSVMEPSNQRNIIYIACGILAIAIIILNIDGVDLSPLKGGGGGASAAPEPKVEFIDPYEVDIVTDPVVASDDGGNESDSSDPVVADQPTTDDQPTPPDEAEVVPKPRLPKVPMLDPDIQRGPIPQEKEEYLRGKWGGWHFWDGDVDSRPNEDYIHQHPNGDIPGDQFPDSSWQVDAVYVNHYLDSASDLVQMAMEAIYTEYGWGKPLDATGMAERIKMFRWDRLDLETQEAPPPTYARRGARDTGGWTTKRSFDGLIRRLIHAMITQDTFTVVLAGHSAAMGEGNHFRQSYMMQFHQIMKPIFERLGVKLITRNLSYGGLGTIQSGMAGGDILGHEIDLLLWDAGMTENCCPAHIDLVFRQAILSGNRVPVIWANGPFELLRTLHETFDVDVGEYGTGMYGIKPVESKEQAESDISYAARFLKCASEAPAELCSQDRFAAKCWIDRDDGIKPEANQRDRPKGQVKWHPGWRAHQLQGRVLAFALLEAIEVACNRWMDGTMTGQPLDDSYWHVTEYYENIRNKVREEGVSVGKCLEIEEQLPKRMCYTPMKGRTQYSPRADYEHSSLASIVQPVPDDGYVPANTKTALYDGPDVHNPVYDIPEDAVDVLAIVMNRRRSLAEEENGTSLEAHYLEESLNDDSTMKNNLSTTITVSTTTSFLRRHRKLDDSITPGKGWEIFDEPQGLCDGTYDATCAHSTDNECFLIGHHASRGAIVGTEWSGWLVMKLESLTNGLIVLKLHTWHTPNENPRTESWTSENNEGGAAPPEEVPPEPPAEAEEAPPSEPVVSDPPPDEQPAEVEEALPPSEPVVADPPPEDQPAVGEQLPPETPAEEQPQPDDAGEETADNQDGRQRSLLLPTATREQHSRKLDGEEKSCSSCGELDEDGFDATTGYDDDDEQERERDRQLKNRSYDTPELPDAFIFEYAIDGQITTLNKDEFLAKKMQLQRVVETLTLLDDPNFIQDGQPKDVEVAIRLKGVARQVVFGVSHIYWS